MTTMHPTRVLAGVGSLALLLCSALATARDGDGEEGNALDEIVVVASKIGVPRRQVGTAVSTIEADEIELRGYIAMADVLRTQPGVAVSTNGGIGTTTSVRIRGEEAFRTQAFIDGIRLADPTAPQVAPNFSSLLSTADIARVEILRGPQGFIYGADSGGVIDISTKRGAGDLEADISAEYGEFDSTLLEGSASGGSETLDFFVSVSDASSDGFNSRSSDDMVMDDDGYDNTTLHGKFGWNLSENLRLQFVARNSDAETEFDGCGFPRTEDCLSTSDETALRLSADHAAGPFTNLVAVSNLNSDRDSIADGVSSFATDGDLLRAEYTGSFAVSDETTFVYGIDYQNEEIAGSDENLERNQTGAYLEYQGAFDDRFFLTAGARYDDNEDFGTFTSLRLTTAYVQDLGSNASLKYRASIGTGFRAPSLYEISYNSGPFAFPPASDTVLEQEESRGYDLGIEYATASGLFVSLGWFDQEIDNAIFFDLAGFSGYLQEPGISTSRGVELSWDIPVGTQWALLGNVTYNDTEDAEGSQRIRRPEWVGNLGVRMTAFDDRFRLLANVRTAQDVVDEIFGIGVVPLDNYAVFDLSGAYDVTPAVAIYARVQNAFDEDYQEVIDYNSGGRAAYAGVRYSF